MIRPNSRLTEPPATCRHQVLTDPAYRELWPKLNFFSGAKSNFDKRRQTTLLSISFYLSLLVISTTYYLVPKN